MMAKASDIALQQYDESMRETLEKAEREFLAQFPDASIESYCKSGGIYIQSGGLRIKRVRYYADKVEWKLCDKCLLCGDAIFSRKFSTPVELGAILRQEPPWNTSHRNYSLYCDPLSILARKLGLRGRDG